MADLRVTLVKSPIGNRPAARATVEAIGLRRLHQSVRIPDNESTRGMVKAVAHLVEVDTGDVLDDVDSMRGKSSVSVSKPDYTPTESVPTPPKKRSAKPVSDIQAEGAADEADGESQ